jgi:hypothetical protein
MFQASDVDSCPNSETLNSDGLHSCISCNVLHFALFQDAAKAVEIMETNTNDLSESTMEHIEKPEDESDLLKFHPTASDMEIVKSDSEEATGTVTSTDAKGPKLPSVSAAPSLANTDIKTIRDMKAQIEEIHQVIATDRLRHAETERQLTQCKREIMTLKRRRVDSAGGSEPTSVTSRASHSSSSRSRSRAPLPEARMRGDIDQERLFQSSLPSRGPGLSELSEKLKNPEFFYPWRKQGTKSPLQRGRTIPKLEKQGIEFKILEAMSSNALMEWICLVSSLLYHCGANPRLPDWVPVEYLSCPLQLALEKLESLSPAAYFCMLRTPNFLSQDRLGVAATFYSTPQTLPRGDIPVTVMMSARGRYAGYRFGSRNVVEKVRDRREQQVVMNVPPEAPTVPLLDQQNQLDLRSLLTPKKPDLRNNLGRKQVPAPPIKRKEPKMVMVTPDPSFIGPHTYSGTDLFDIRERSKLDSARQKEKEAEAALEKERAARKEAEREEEAREVDRKMRELTRYRDALMRNNSSSPKGKHGVVPRSRKRSRSPTPPSRQTTSSPSASRSPPSSSRQRGTTRAGKGKDKRRSFSRSPSLRHHPREPRPSSVTVPGLCLGPREERRSRRRREFSHSKSPPRAKSRSPSSSPSWQTCHRRPGRR